MYGWHLSIINIIFHAHVTYVTMFVLTISTKIQRLLLKQCSGYFIDLIEYFDIIGHIKIVTDSGYKWVSL